MHAFLEVGDRLRRDDLLRKLVDMLYDRNDYDFHRGTFRVRGDTVEIFPAYEDERALRVEFFGDEIESIAEIDPLRGRTLARLSKSIVFPNSHYVSTPDRIQRAIEGIREELDERIQHFRREDKLLEAQRIEQRTLYDIEMLSEMGFCHGVENYSRWLDGREAGQTPFTLINYFPSDFLCVVDESHVGVPQIGGMFRGDRRRKETLVEFRFPAALGTGQPPAALRRMGAASAQRGVRLGHPSRVRTEKMRGRDRRTDHPPHRPDGPRGRDPAREEPGR